MPKCDFNKVALPHFGMGGGGGGSPVNLLHIFRTHFPKNTSGGLHPVYMAAGWKEEQYFLEKFVLNVQNFQEKKIAFFLE